MSRAHDIDNYCSEHTDRGINLNGHGRHEEALEEFDLVLARSPFSAGTNVNKSWVLYDMGRMRDSLNEARRAAELAPDMPAAHAAAGRALIALGRHKEAEASLYRAVCLDAQDWGAWNDLGISRYSMGDTEGALKAFKSAVRLQPSSASARLNTASVLLGMERHKEALRQAEAAKKIAPEDAQVLIVYATALAALGMIQEARFELDLAVVYWPRNVFAQMTRAVSLAVLGLGREAFGAIESAQAADPGCVPDGFCALPDSAPSGPAESIKAVWPAYEHCIRHIGIRAADPRFREDHMHIVPKRRMPAGARHKRDADPDGCERLTEEAKRLYGMGRLEEGAKAATDAARLDPERSDPHVIRALILYKMRKLPMALRAAELAVQISPGNSGGHMMRAMLLREGGRHEDALAGFNCALGLTPGVAECLEGRAQCLSALSRPHSALAAAEEALAAGAGHEAARVRAWSLGAVGRTKEAASAYARLKKQFPDDVKLHLECGAAYAKGGMHDEAVSEFEAAAALDPRDEDSRIGIAESLAGMGRTKEALEAFDRAVGACPASHKVASAKARFLLSLGRRKDAAECLQNAYCTQGEIDLVLACRK